METVEMKTGNYTYIPGVLQYSAGVAATSGFRIERVKFSRPLPMKSGFARIAAHLAEIGRPRTAFCACELRSPGQFNETDFAAFNKTYTDVLREWGVMTGQDNPVARSNVCPELDGPAEPSFYAFSYTVADDSSTPSFVIAGSGEAPEGGDDYASVTVRRGDTSEDGLREKARYVLSEMERRMAFFQAGWTETTAVQLYTVHNAYPLFADQIVSRGAARHGLTWHFDRPPVVGLDFEMDCRRVGWERVIVTD